MSIKIEIKTTHFTPKRFSNPWIAKVDFSKDPQGTYAWGKWIGDAKFGTDGLLIIDGLEPGDIVATGQKDAAGKKTKVEWFQVRARNWSYCRAKLRLTNWPEKPMNRSTSMGMCTVMNPLELSQR